MANRQPYTFSSRLAMEPILQQLEQKTRHHTRRLEIRLSQNAISKTSSSFQRRACAHLGATEHNQSPRSHTRLSSVLFQNDRIIGWLLTFPLLDETLDYRILWIDSAHRKTGLAITALSQIIRKAHFQDNLGAATMSNDLGNPWLKDFSSCTPKTRR